MYVVSVSIHVHVPYELAQDNESLDCLPSVIFWLHVSRCTEGMKECTRTSNGSFMIRLAGLSNRHTTRLATGIG